MTRSFARFVLLPILCSQVGFGTPGLALAAGKTAPQSAAIQDAFVQTYSKIKSWETAARDLGMSKEDAAFFENLRQMGGYKGAFPQVKLEGIWLKFNGEAIAVSSLRGGVVSVERNGRVAILHKTLSFRETYQELARTLGDGKPGAGSKKSALYDWIVPDANALGPVAFFAVVAGAGFVGTVVLPKMWQGKVEADFDKMLNDETARKNLEQGLFKIECHPVAAEAVIGSPIPKASVAEKLFNSCMAGMNAYYSSYQSEREALNKERVALQKQRDSGKIDVVKYNELYEDWVKRNDKLEIDNKFGKFDVVEQKKSGEQECRVKANARALDQAESFGYDVWAIEMGGKKPSTSIRAQTAGDKVEVIWDSKTAEAEAKTGSIGAKGLLGTRTAMVEQIKSYCDKDSSTRAKLDRIMADNKAKYSSVKDQEEAFNRLNSGTTASPGAPDKARQSVQ